jgi:hypothetical protein
MTNGYNLSPKRCPNALLRSHASGQVPRLNKFSGPQRFFTVLDRDDFCDVVLPYPLLPLKYPACGKCGIECGVDAVKGADSCNSLQVPSRSHAHKYCYMFKSLCLLNISARPPGER